MFQKKLAKNRKGVGPVVAFILMMMVTVAAMVIVISFGLDFIDRRSAQISERLCVEKVIFDESNLKIYVRNIGNQELTLEQCLINNNIYDLQEGKVYLTYLGQFVTIENYEISDDDVYEISFFSSFNNQLGHTVVEAGLLG